MILTTNSLLMDWLFLDGLNLLNEKIALHSFRVGPHRLCVERVNGWGIVAGMVCSVSTQAGDPWLGPSDLNPFLKLVGRRSSRMSAVC